MMQELVGQTSFSTVSMSTTQNLTFTSSVEDTWQKVCWNMEVLSCLSLFSNIAQTSQGNILFHHIISWFLKLDFK